jgi:hypothetical protein
LTPRTHTRAWLRQRFAEPRITIEPQREPAIGPPLCASGDRPLPCPRRLQLKAKSL